MNNLQTVIVKEVEKKGLSLLISRIKSKSPAFYRNLQIVGGIVSASIGSLSLYLQNNPNLFAHENVALIACQFATAFFAGIVVTASTTTKSAELLSTDVKQAVVDNIVQQKNAGNNPTT